MKLTKRVLAVILSLALCLPFSCVGVLADDGIPDDLPKGTIKIAEGIYAYTPDVMTANDSEKVNIGTVPAYGNIVQPGSFNNVVVEPSTDYLIIQCSKNIRINFVRGSQSVFGGRGYFDRR